MLMRIVYMGSPEAAIYPLKHLLESQQYTVCAVVSQPPQVQGRGRQKTPEDPPLARFSKDRGLLTLQPEKARDPLFLETLRGLAPDVIVTCAYGQILTDGFLAIPKRATINIHPSRLPQYRGAIPVPQALYDGLESTALTVLFTVKALDAGNIILQKDFKIGPEETSGQLLTRLFQEAGPLLLEALEALRDEDFLGTPQDPEAVSHCRKINKEDGQIDWYLPARVIYQRFKAFEPWPGSYTFFGGKRLIVTSMALSSEDPFHASESVGRAVLSQKSKHIQVKTGEGTLELLSVKPEGKSVQEARVFWNGLKGDKEDARFESHSG